MSLWGDVSDAVNNTLAEKLQQSTIPLQTAFGLFAVLRITCALTRLQTLSAICRLDAHPVQ